MMDILNSLKLEFNSHVTFREKRPGIVQVLAPLFALVKRQLNNKRTVSSRTTCFATWMNRFGDTTIAT